jgi:hypothetical protein
MSKNLLRDWEDGRLEEETFERIRKERSPEEVPEVPTKSHTPKYERNEKRYPDED